MLVLFCYFYCNSLNTSYIAWTYDFSQKRLARPFRKWLDSRLVMFKSTNSNGDVLKFLIIIGGRQIYTFPLVCKRNIAPLLVIAAMHSHAIATYRGLSWADFEMGGADVKIMSKIQVSPNM